jgi:L-alanine-DL-glutamate epimerase-like enolase superfamily enzyme
VPETHSLAGLPLQPPVVRTYITLRLRTDDGIEGIAVTFPFFSSPMTHALRSAVQDLASLSIGEDPLVPGTILGKLRGAAGGSGPGGLFMLAFSAIDIALWDIRGKALNQPVWKLLGGGRQRVPAYASGAIQRNLSNEEALQAARGLVEKGFRQIKMQLGLGGEHSPAKEAERARIVRETVGPDITLMADVNQLWRVEQAIDVGRRIEKLQLFWLEDLTVHDDFAGLARISDTLVTPVAGGEYVWGIAPFRHMLEARSVDILIIDALRVGGITQWMKVAGMAEAFNTRVVNHCFPEFLVHVVAAAPNAFTLEYMPWTLPLFEEIPKLENGEVTVPDRPGLGLKFNEDFVKRHAV